MSAPIKITKLSKSYGAILAAAEISFEVEAGEVFGLLGANGAGKTTVLECLVGLKQPDTGEIHIAGIDVRTDPRHAHEQLGASLQNTSLPEKLTPREALWLFGSFHRRSTAPSELLSQFALQDKADAPYGTLSVGQRQRLALALSVVNEPAVLVLDEPSSGLDPQARRELHTCLRAMKLTGKTILISTHDLGEAADLCDRVAVLRKGHLVAVGSPRGLRDAGGQRQSVHFRSYPMVASGTLAALPGVQGVVSTGEGHRLFTRDPSATIQALNRLVVECRHEILELRIEGTDFTETYFDIAGGTNPETPS